LCPPKGIFPQFVLFFPPSFPLRAFSMCLFLPLFSFTHPQGERESLAPIFFTSARSHPHSCTSYPFLFSSFFFFSMAEVGAGKLTDLLPSPWPSPHAERILFLPTLFPFQLGCPRSPSIPKKPTRLSSGPDPRGTFGLFSFPPSSPPI